MNNLSGIPVSERLAIIRSPEKCPEHVSFANENINDDQATNIAQTLKICTHITYLHLDRNSIKDKGAKELGDALKSNTSIQYLNISDNQMTFEGAKEVFRGLKVNRALTALSFNRNQLASEDPEQREIWIALQFNKCLQTLNLAENRLTDQTMVALCKGLSTNRSITSLNLAGNNITGQGISPIVLQGLSSPSLTQLDLSQNPFVPEFLTSLTQLISSNPSITDLKLSHLPSKTIQGPEYNLFLADLQTNSNLKSLNLSDTPFSLLICDIIATNTTLQKLNLRGTLIRNDELNAITQALSVNTTLKELDLSDNLARLEAIQSFCQCIKTNTTLEHLSFARNIIGEAAKDLADAIMKNKHLLSINIDGSKELTRIGKKQLIISLAANPPLLKFSMNDVSMEADLAPEIAKALKANTHLEEFYLKRNTIYSKSTPETATDTLITLFVSSPSLVVMEVDIPDPMGRLFHKNLENRALTEFPNALLKMTSLQSLNLANNYITMIPSGISNLTDLKELDISSNRLLTLPPSMGFLTNLKVLKLTSNPFRTPPPEVLSKNNVKLVLGYLRDLAKGAEPVYRIKLMMVGQENVGKTTLLRHIKRRRLRRPPKKAPIKPTISTDGIDVDEWQLEVPFDDDKDYTLTTTTAPAPVTATSLISGGSFGSASAGTPTSTALSTAPPTVRHISRGPSASVSANRASTGEDSVNRKLVTVSSWDFAGQEIYYTTHQFFLSQRALYILVWDLRFDDDECKVSYWLQSIRSRTNNSPVIIVGTHADELSPEEATLRAEKVRKKYQKRFPFIKFSLAVSCKNDNDINNLVTKIRDVIRVQDHTGELIPKTYVEMERLIRAECAAIKENKASYPPIRSWSEIQTIASYCHILDEDELRRCIHLLHDFGSLIYFDDPSLGVEDLVIVDSQFLTNVMATIITTKTSIRDGLLPHKLIPMIWRPPEFPPAIHDILLSLLKKFEIAYTLPPQLRAKFDLRHPTSTHTTPARRLSSGSLSNPLNTTSNGIIGSTTSLLASSNASVPSMSSGVSSPRSSSMAFGSLSSTNNSPLTSATLPISSSSLGGLSSFNNAPLLNLPPPPMPLSKSAPQVGHQTLLVNGSSSLESSETEISPAVGLSASATTLSPNINSEVSSASSSPTMRPLPVPQSLSESASSSPINRPLPVPPGQAPPSLPPQSLPPPQPPQTHTPPLPTLATTAPQSLPPQPPQTHTPPLPTLPSIAPLLPVQAAEVPTSTIQPSLSQTALATPATNSTPTAAPVTTHLGVVVLPDEKDLETLIPSLLPEERPDFDLLWRNYDPAKLQFDRRYQLEFVPKGFFSRLMIRILHHVDSVMAYWRNGIIAERGKDIFLVELRPNEAVLVLSVRGPRSSPPTDTFRMCVETVDMLIGLNNWFNIKVQKMVPCAHCVELQKEEREVYMFPLTTLEQKAVNGIWSIECEANQNDKKSMHLTRLVPDMALSDLERSKIPYEDLSLLEEVGKGAFGVIHRAMYGNFEVAVKVMKGSSQDDAKQKAFNEFRKEVHVMSGMKHPNLVNMIGFCVNPFALVMEYLPSGNLYKFLHKPDVPDISWALRLKIALDIAIGMHYLHTATPPFIHRDLKSPNVLLLSTDYRSEVCAKVGDFGLSSRMYVPAFKEKSITRDVGNPTWLAPEIIREEEFCESSDVYSYGIILWELLTRQHPYGEFHYEFMFELEDIIKKGIRPTIPMEAPMDYANLITQCVLDNPTLRPTFYNIIKVLVSLASDLAPELFIPPDLFTKLENSSSFDSGSHLDSNADDSDPVGFAGQFIKQLSTQPVSKIYSMVLATDNQIWCGTREGSILIWNTKNGQLLAKHDNIHKSAITSIFTAGNYIWTHAWGEKARVWKTLDPEQVQQIMEKKEPTTEGWLTHKTGGLTKKLKRRWTVINSKRFFMYKEEGEKVPITMFDLEGAKVTVDAKSKNPQFTLQPKSLREKPLIFQAKDRQEMLDWVAAIETEIGKQELKFEISYVAEVDTTDVRCFHVHDGLVWGGTIEMRLKAWDMEKFQLSRNMEVDISNMLPADASGTMFINAIAEYDNRIWIGAQKYLVCLDKASLIPLRCLVSHTHTINAILGYEGRVWTCSDDCTIRVWDAFSYECLQTFSEVGGKQFAMVKVGSQIWVAGWDGIIRVFNGKTAQLQRALEMKHQDAIYAFALSYGSVWAGSWDGTVSIWS